MDIQLAFDPYAVTSCIVSYMNKDESQMTKFLSDALKTEKKQNAKEKLRTLQKCFLTHRQVGISEAVYRLLPGMHLKDSNIKCIFVLTGFPGNRSQFWQKLQGETNDEINVDEKKDDEEETEVQANEGTKRPVKIPGRNGYFTEAITIHERYAARPESDEAGVRGRLEDICLAQFSTCYTPIKKLPKKAEIIVGGSEIG